MIYLYIHGFGGNGKGTKATLFREYFGESLLAPSLSYIPDLAIDTLEQLIEHLLKNDEITLIGSSLGGYYAIYLSERYSLNTVLINPSVRPYETLARVFGQSYSFYDESQFEWNDAHIEMLRKFDTHSITPHRYLVLLQTGDELLDYTQALIKFDGSNVIVEEGGNHSYDNIQSKFTMIASSKLFKK